MKEMLGVVALVLFSSLAVAQIPGVPHQFYGSVDFINGPAPDGLLVEAKIDGVIAVNTITLNGKYGYDPEMFFVTDPLGNRNNKTIYFYVNGIDTGETELFKNGATTELNLSVPASIPTTTTQPAGGGGSGGGGGGGVGGKPKPSCFDGIVNCHDGSCEEGVDCGGPCDPCMSCEDGIQNQGEEGVDCGGPCEPCPITTTIAPTTTVAPETTISPTTTAAPVTTTTAGETTTTTIVPPSAIGGVIAAAGGSVVIVVLLFLLLFVAYYLKRGKK